MNRKGGRRGRTRAPPPSSVSRSPSPGHAEVELRSRGYLELAEIAEKELEARRAHHHRRRRSSRTRSCERNNSASQHFLSHANNINNGRHEDEENRADRRQLPLQLEAAAIIGPFDEKESQEPISFRLEGHNSYGDIGPKPDDLAMSNDNIDGEKLVENSETQQQTHHDQFVPNDVRVIQEDGNVDGNLEEQHILNLTGEKIIIIDDHHQKNPLVVVTDDKACSPNESVENLDEKDSTEISNQNKISDNDFEKKEEETQKVSSSISVSELNQFPRLSTMPQLNFGGAITDPIDFQHRQNMGYLDTYLDRIVDVTQSSKSRFSHHHPLRHRRLTLTPQLPPEVSLIPSNKIEAGSLFQSQFEEEDDPLKIKPLLNSSLASNINNKGNNGRKPSYLEGIKKTFALASSKLRMKDHHNNNDQGLDSVVLARIRKAKRERGPFWKVEIFEKNRAKNKTRDNSYAITFGFKLKQSQVHQRRKKINLFRFENFLRSKKKVYDENDNQFNNLHYPDSKLASFPEKLLDYDNEMQLTNNNNYDDEARLVQDFNLQQENANKKYSDIFAKDHHRHYQPIQGRVNPHKGQNKYLPESISLSPFLQNSSKLSEKTQSLLQKARSSSSAGQTPTSSSVQDRKNRNNYHKNGKLFNENTLTKIYTPKTEFTRQFASLLPSWNQDKFI